MTNAPDRSLTWRWEEDPDQVDELAEDFAKAGVTTALPSRPQRVIYTKDGKRPNAGTFVFGKEDHTLGNLLRLQLLRDPTVRYAGYRMPHPLVFDCHVRVETVDAKTRPVQVIFVAFYFDFPPITIFYCA